MVDDAAITFAYARNIDEGLGPVQQAGAPPVEGYSNPTWLALLVVGRRIGLFDHRAYFGVPDLVLFPKLLALLCVAGILLAVAGAARRMVANSWIVTALSGVLLAFSFPFVVWVFSGLENPLYALLATVLAAVLIRASADGTLLTRGPALASGLLALGAALTRPDGAILAGAYPLLLLLHLRRADLTPAVRATALSVGAFVLPYAAFIGWRYWMFGRLVPNTAVAKRQELPPSELFAQQTGGLLSYAGWTAVLVATLVIGAALSRPGTLRRALPAVLPPLALTLIAFGVLEPDWMGMFRFSTPVWALGVLALTPAAVGLVEQGVLRTRIVIPIALSCSLLLSWSGQQKAADSFRAYPTLPMCLVVNRDGVMFNEYADRLGIKNASVLLPSLGGTLLTSDLKVYDLAGLTEPRIADLLAEDDIKGLQQYAFDELRPTFIHAVAVWAEKTDMKAPQLTAAGYVPLYRQGVGGDWVRADAVRDSARLESVRAWAAHAVPESRVSGRNRCGTDLEPGLRYAASK
ncbi:hypothetical protein P8605_32535 [Streptomyces sp. T-3]|nr:hypothetical protein [Streptomyces sp. T-3]